MIEISLCAPPRCSCPKMFINRELKEIRILDDYEGVVTMSIDDFEELARLFKQQQDIYYGEDE